MIRFAHEMNGHWYPWASTVNGGSAKDYVAAWRHVHDVFAAHGVTNVAWVWSPNVNRYLKSVKLKPLYPGDAYVDIVGMVGYGTQRGETFKTTFGSTISEIRTFTSKPLLITETGAAEKPSNKPAWTASFFKALSVRHDVIGFVWFNQTKREAWRVTTSTAALNAYKRGVASYVKKWTLLKK
jgi:beta-mannanase